MVSTAAGSSGHSLSAGGPLLHPTLSCAVLNMISPRTLSFRPLIVPMEAEDRVQIGLAPEGKAKTVDVILDGVTVGEMLKTETITV